MPEYPYVSPFTTECRNCGIVNPPYKRIRCKCVIGLRERLMRRVWWALLPHEGWVAERRAGLPDPPGSIPPPWYAFPLARVWRWVDRWMTETHDYDIFGPEYNAFLPRPDNWRKQPEPWR